MTAKYEDYQEELGQYIRKQLKKYGRKSFLIRPLDKRSFSSVTTSVTNKLKYDLDVKKTINSLLQKIGLTFSEKLLELIKDSGRKPSEIYNHAGITKDHFAKIKKNKDYHPSKETALAFAVALHLKLEAAEDLIGRAGYSLNNSAVADIVVKFFIEKRQFDIMIINEALEDHGCKPLTNWRNN